MPPALEELAEGLCYRRHSLARVRHRLTRVPSSTTRLAGILK
jgi:hypothetical protein